MNDFIVAYRNGTVLTYSHSESSFSEASISIPPADIDDTEYVIICPAGYQHKSIITEPIKASDLPF